MESPLPVLPQSIFSLVLLHGATEQQEKVCILGTVAGGAEIGYRPHFSVPLSLHLHAAGCIKHKRHLHVREQIFMCAEYGEAASSILSLLPQTLSRPTKGASINDICKIFGIFNPLSLVCIWI